MMSLAAFARVLAYSEPPVRGKAAQKVYAAVGHLGLAVIALVFVLVTCWNG